MNDENLIPVRSESEARELGRKGGKASGEARRAKRLLKDALEIALEMAMKNKDGTPAVHPVTGKPLVGFDAGMVKLVERYTKGDQKAIETVAKLLGQWIDKTENKHEIAGGIVIVTADEMEKAALERMAKDEN